MEFEIRAYAIAMSLTTLVGARYGRMGPSVNVCSNYIIDFLKKGQSYVFSAS